MIENRIVKQELVRWRDLCWFQTKGLKELPTDSMQKLKCSLETNNFIQPFNVWDDGAQLWILDGHHRQRAMQELEASGITIADELPANFIDCQNRKEAAKLVLIYSSAYARVAKSGLADFLQEFDLSAIDLNVELSLPDLNFESLFDLASEDVEETPVPVISPEDVITQRGDLYELGAHRLLCGDSTNADDVARLMSGEIAHLLFTDPPYNVNYAELNADARGGKDWGEVYCNEWRDSMSDEDYANFLVAILRNAKKHLVQNAHYYVWYASKYHTELIAAFTANEIPYDPVPIVWSKQRFLISWRRYHCQYEPCIFGGKGAPTMNGANARWHGPANETNIWEISLDHNGNYVHPTQKPIALPVRAIQNSTVRGECVLELFGGSGSTLLGCEQTGRVCRAIELEPAFCDAIVRRYISYCEKHGIEPAVKRNGEVVEVEMFEITTN